MQQYELTYLSTSEVAEKIEKIIEGKGKIIKSEAPKRIKLSYPIQKKLEASLATVEFRAEPKNLEMLKKALEENPAIMRFLLVKKEVAKIKKEPLPEEKVEAEKTDLEKIL